MNKNVNIYIADDIHQMGINLLQNIFNVINLKGFTNTILLNKIKLLSNLGSIKKSALIIRSVRKLDKQFLKSLSESTNVKLICTVSSGFDNIDLIHCKKYKIDVLNVAGANSISAAEHTFALILSISKNILPADKDMKSGIYNYNKFNNVELHSKTIGIIGVGRIGSKVAKIAKAFGMNILGNDIDPKVKRKYSSINFVALNELIKKSDIITIHTPLNDSTYQLINGKNLSLFHSGSILINCSRGGTVDENPLIKALSKNKLFYAGIDVFENEPFFNNKLTKLKNVILSPHLAGKTVESKQRMAINAAESVIQYFTKKQSKHKFIN